MNKKQFVVHLPPSRPDPAQMMTDEKHSTVQAHIAYWKEHLQRRTMPVLGPELLPKGGYGLGIIAADSEEHLQGLLKDDPASRIAQYEAFSVMAVTPVDF